VQSCFNRFLGCDRNGKSGFVRVSKVMDYFTTLAHFRHFAF
jgi:hypothetical protein